MLALLYKLQVDGLIVIIEGTPIVKYPFQFTVSVLFQFFLAVESAYCFYIRVVDNYAEITVLTMLLLISELLQASQLKYLFFSAWLHRGCSTHS